MMLTPGGWMDAQQHKTKKNKGKNEVYLQVAQYCCDETKTLAIFFPYMLVGSYEVIQARVVHFEYRYIVCS